MNIYNAFYVIRESKQYIIFETPLDIHVGMSSKYRAIYDSGNQNKDLSFRFSILMTFKSTKKDDIT